MQSYGIYATRFALVHSQHHLFPCYLIFPQLTTATNVLIRLQGKLADLTRRSEEETSRIQNLESENRELLDTVKDLEARNALLEASNCPMPDFEMAIETRDSALRKLRHARKFIRDILEVSLLWHISTLKHV